MRIYKSAHELIGNTPLLELRNIKKELNLKSYYIVDDIIILEKNN